MVAELPVIGARVDAEAHRRARTGSPMAAQGGNPAVTQLAERKGNNRAGAWAQEAGKRAMDIALAVVLIVVMTPLLLLLWCLVRSTSAGPAFFRQERSAVT